MTAPPTAAATSFLPQPTRFTAMSSGLHSKQLSKSQPPAGSALPLVERNRAPGWLQSTQVSSVPKASVQVTVAGGQVSGSLSTVTIQAQQYLEGVWSISRVNNVLPPPKTVRLFVFFSPQTRDTEIVRIFTFGNIPPLLAGCYLQASADEPEQNSIHSIGLLLGLNVTQMLRFRPSDE